VAGKPDYLASLQVAIRLVHQCNAIHRQTVSVHETVDSQTIWKGEVEVFDLTGHAEAKKCFAWSHSQKGKGVRFVTLLEKWPVNSPEMAVKSAIFFDAQPAPFPSQILPC